MSAVAFSRLLSFFGVLNIQSANYYKKDRNRFSVINTALFRLLNFVEVCSQYFSPWFISSPESHGSFEISSLSVCIIILAYPAVSISPGWSVFVFLFISITMGECEGTHMVCVICGLPKCFL